MSESEGFDNLKGDYHSRDRRGGPTFKPRGANKHWPHFQCINSCGFNVPEDDARIKCPNCQTPLVRYTGWEVKR